MDWLDLARAWYIIDGGGLSSSLPGRLLIFDDLELLLLDDPLPVDVFNEVCRGIPFPL